MRFGGSGSPGKDNAMTPDTNQSSKAADLMRTCKAACDKAAAGPKKDAALKHYHAAEKAHAAKNDAECVTECNAATLALA